MFKAAVIRCGWTPDAYRSSIDTTVTLIWVISRLSLSCAPVRDHILSCAQNHWSLSHRHWHW